MSMNSIGDLAQNFLLQRRSGTLKNEITSLSHELSSGQADDLIDHLGGTYGRLSAIENDMRVLSGFKTTQAELTQMTTTMQNALERIRIEAGELGNDLLNSKWANSSSSVATTSGGARQKFETVVSVLNQQSAGRSLFAGDATDGAALASADTIIAALSAEIAAAPDAATAIAAVDNWFADPAGFESVGYLGSDTALSPVQVSKSAKVTVDPRADAEEIKDVLRNAALAVLPGEPGFSLSRSDAELFFQQAGEGLLTVQDKLIGMQARLGFSEEQVAKWTSRTAAEMTGLEYEKGALIAVDPYETATRLEAAQLQLQSLYAVTSRLSNLSLVNYL